MIMNAFQLFSDSAKRKSRAVKRVRPSAKAAVRGIRGVP